MTKRSGAKRDIERDSAGDAAARADGLVEERSGVLLLRVRAAPRASREGVQGTYGAALKVAVHAPPEAGKANAALAKAIARTLGLNASQVLLESGKSSRDKSFRIEGLTRGELERRLGAILERGR